MKKTYRLLLVDDDQHVLDALELAFTATDHEVSKTTSPVEAYKMIENEHFDIVISDIMMKEMDGLTLLTKIKDFNGMIQVIMITGNITINNAIKAFRYGAADLFFKPFEDINEIVSSVDQIVKRINRVNQILAMVARGRGQNA